MTFEHDAYRNGETIKNKSRALFKKLGYQLLCGNVCGMDEKQILYPYEDWWVNPEYMEEKNWRLGCEYCHWKTILERM
jgi:hypothetical protein